MGYVYATGTAEKGNSVSSRKATEEAISFEGEALESKQSGTKTLASNLTITSGKLAPHFQQLLTS